MRKISATGLIVLAALTLAACGNLSWQAGETTIPSLKPPRDQIDLAPVSKALCVSWGQSLPTRSREDTNQTQDEIEAAYVTFAAACPNHIDLIP